MIRWLFILIITPLCWGGAPVQVQENESAPAQEQNMLILVDLQGALFYPKTVSTKVASIQNQQVANAIKKYQQQKAKILYLAEYSSEAMFWQNSIKASHLPLEERFSLDSQAFGGFEGSIPSCRNGIVLCQGQPLGEILGLVINQLWVWTQFSPQKILFYTVSKQRGEIVSAIGLRIGALVEINLVEGIVGNPPVPEVKESLKRKVDPSLTMPPQQKKPKVTTVEIPAKQPKKAAKKPNKVQVTTENSTEPASSKLEVPSDESPKKADVIEPTKEPKKELPPIVIDESKLEYV
jgi:hypothetical protein